jgi:hypothetical protein
MALYRMGMFHQFFSFFGISTVTIFLLVLLVVWETAWKGIALWKSGRNKQLVWFICIFIFNTLGLLPIIYLLFFQKKRERKAARRRKRK